MAAPISGQVALSGSAQPLSRPVTVAAFVIKAPLTNAHPAFIGPNGVTSTTGPQMDPGDVLEYEGRDQNGLPRYEVGLADFYVVGTGGDVVTWLSSP